MKLVTVSQMRSIEQEANQFGYTFAQMMEAAGTGLGRIVDERYSDIFERKIIGLVGSGNNGGDTLIALSTLANKGWQAVAYLLNPRGIEDPLVKRLLDAGGRVIDYGQDQSIAQLKVTLESSAVVLDGILGTGLKLPLKKEVAQFLGAVKAEISEQVVIAVDCPSGVDCESGEAAAECIQAEMTVCMEAVKVGLLKIPAFGLTGELVIVELGLPSNLPSLKEVNNCVVDRQMAVSFLPERPISGHKGTFGTAMVVAGSVNYTGAALLAARSAYRIGCGLVRLAVPGPLHTVLAGQLPEATWLILPHEMGVIAESAAAVLRDNLQRVDSMLLGPGWGTEDTTAAFLQQLINNSSNRISRSAIGFVGSSINGIPDLKTDLPPLVIDADGLKLMARIKGWEKIIPALTVLTPHPGEMGVLTGLSIEEIQKGRIEIARKYARQWGHVIVLKGAFTVVAAPDGRIGVIPIATSALAHAGTGDVLAGMITGLRAQGVEAYEAALAGSWLHGRAGLLAAEWVGAEASVLASDVIEAIPETLQEK